MRVNHDFNLALQRLVQSEQGVTSLPRGATNPIRSVSNAETDKLLSQLSDREKALLAVLVLRARNQEPPDLPVEVSFVPKAALGGADVARGSQSTLFKGPLHQNLQPFQILLEAGRFNGLASGLLASMSYAAENGNRALVFDLVAQLKAALLALRPDVRQHIQTNDWPDIERRMSGILSGLR
jgi:hypothetical protein